jgi:hypothetical protein
MPRTPLLLQDPQVAAFLVLAFVAVAQAHRVAFGLGVVLDPQGDLGEVSQVVRVVGRPAGPLLSRDDCNDSKSVGIHRIDRVAGQLSDFRAEFETFHPEAREPGHTAHDPAAGP